MKLNGSQIVMECLLEQGVDTVFGYPGGSILNVYDALYHYRDRIHHVRTSHEQGAAHAADGYARTTGKVGVCFATSGPGATNLVTGLATAYMDSVPVVAITCNVGNAVLGKDSFQEVDIAGVAIPITKYGTIVKRVEDVAPTIRRAFRLARKGRSGPVLVDITKDVTAAVTEFEPKQPDPIVKDEVKIREKELETALSMIQEAKKPVIFAGGGVIAAEASAELAEFVDRVDAPVTLSLMGQGAFDEADSRYMGMLGMHGTKTTNFSVAECDLLIGVGVRFSDRCTGNTEKFASNAKIIHIDIDPAEINKNIRTDAAIIGDIKPVLQELNARLEKQSHPEWMEKVQERKQKYPMPVEEGLSGPWIISMIDENTPEDTVIVTDVGQHQMWSAQYYTYRHPRTFLSSGGLGTMGYGLGAAIGAKVAFPDRTVVQVTGDGCFRMNMNELATVSANDLAVITVIVDNHAPGMVRQWQNLFYEKRYSETVVKDKVNYAAVAEALGVKGYTVRTREEAEAAFKEALASGKAAVIDCMTDCDEMVFPMVVPGGLLPDTFDKGDMTEKQ